MARRLEARAVVGARVDARGGARAEAGVDARARDVATHILMCLFLIVSATVDLEVQSSTKKQVSGIAIVMRRRRLNRHMRHAEAGDGRKDRMRDREEWVKSTTRAPSLRRVCQGNDARMDPKLERGGAGNELGSTRHAEAGRRNPTHR
jgi:3'-phosphoadenosine 5'-phosphosulfate sulfotransferase